jgi:hypothetical protein
MAFQTPIASCPPRAARYKISQARARAPCEPVSFRLHFAERYPPDSPFWIAFKVSIECKWGSNMVKIKSREMAPSRRGKVPKGNL